MQRTFFDFTLAKDFVCGWTKMCRYTISVNNNNNNKMLFLWHPGFTWEWVELFKVVYLHKILQQPVWQVLMDVCHLPINVKLSNDTTCSFTAHPQQFVSNMTIHYHLLVSISFSLSLEELPMTSRWVCRKLSASSCRLAWARIGTGK